MPMHPLHYSGTPILLVEQLNAWQQYREGRWIPEIAHSLRRLPSEVRFMLFGHAA